MAMVVRIAVERAGQEDHDRFQQAVESRFGHAGGPPEGLMLHVSYPEGDGFVIVDALRNHELAQEHLDGTLLPVLEELGLPHRPPEVGPAWSIARP